jgi:hypothetical protein
MAAKSIAPAAPASVKVALGEVLFPTITVVEDRALRVDQAWFEGDGRGYVREFIVREGERFCTACNEVHDLIAFPTFSVPRQNGETRGNVCRPAIRARRAAAAKAKAEADAKAARVARAKKAAAASAKVRSAKAAARRAAK